TATFLAWSIDRRGFRGGWICAVAVEILSVTLIVGCYLSILFGVPLAVALSGILVGSLISIGFIGYLLLKAITSPPMVRALRSCGVTLYVKIK
ncbi:MAG: hypothetical protein QXN62_05180, partial [Candidatus Bathyarchaeia archaeon]